MRRVLKAAVVSALLCLNQFSLAEEPDFCDISQPLLDAIERVLRGSCALLEPSRLDEERFINYSDIGITQLTRTDLHFSPNVRILDLSDNRIRSLDPGVFAPVPHLPQLLLSSNEITDLTQLHFGDLKNLLSLSLGRNPFTEMPPGALAALSSLVTLSLNGCRVEHIPDGYFANMPALKEVDVTGCPLSRTTKAAFQGVERVVGLPPNFAVDDANQEWSGE